MAGARRGETGSLELGPVGAPQFSPYQNLPRACPKAFVLMPFGLPEMPTLPPLPLSKANPGSPS